MYVGKYLSRVIHADEDGNLSRNGGEETRVLLITLFSVFRIRMVRFTDIHNIIILYTDERDR